MDTFLPPIDKPNSLMMKMVFYFTRKQFGKVLSPLTVFSARLPTAFGMFYGKAYQLDKKMILSPETAMLIRQRVSQINICSFCMDSGRFYFIKNKMNEAKFDALDSYQSSPLFSEAERAALDYATELTKDKMVNPVTFAQLTHFYSDREICEIVFLIASEHLSNITNIGLNIHSDMLCDITKKN